MRKNGFLLLAAFLAAVFAGCSNLFNELQVKTERGFPSQTRTVSPMDDSGDIGDITITGATSADEGVITVQDNGDGTLTLTSKGPGTTRVKVKGTVPGTNENDDPVPVTLTYDVTVDNDGTITVKEPPTIIKNKTKEIKPKETVSGIEDTTVTSGDEDVVTVTQDDDGTITLTSEGPGTTKVTVKGTDTNGDPVTIIYPVTVSDEGDITVGTPFKKKNEKIKPKEKADTFSTVTEATSEPEGIVTVTPNDDGTVTVTSEEPGETTVTVKGTDTNGDPVTLIYPVTVADDGTVTVGDPTVFKNESKPINPKDAVPTLSTVTEATCEPEDIVTVKKNDDGTITVTSQKPGTTTVTVKGKNDKDEDVTITYEVTVSDDGTVTPGTPTVFTNKKEEIKPEETVTGITDTTVTSSDEDIVTVEKNGDEIIITAQNPGTTTVTVKGTDTNEDPVTITYDVTVDENGNVTVSGSPMVIKNEHKDLTPKTAVPTLSTITEATSDPGDIVTVTKNDDGTITVTSQKPGTTTVKVTGEDENGDKVTLTYDVSVSDDGTLTVTEPPTVIKNEHKDLTPKTVVPTLSTITEATSEPEGIVTVKDNGDGTVTVTSEEPGETTVKVTGEDENGDKVTITYSVTVKNDGTIEVGTPTVFTNEHKDLTPKESVPTLSTITEATSDPEDIVTVTKNDDGTVTVTAQKQGTTTVTVKGKNDKDEDVTITYPVTVADDGKVTVGETTVFTNEHKDLTPKNDVTTTTLSTVTEATSDPEDVVTVTKNDDDTVTVTSQKKGTTTVTVKGTDTNGKPVTLTYDVTVDEKGNITTVLTKIVLEAGGITVTIDPLQDITIEKSTSGGSIVLTASTGFTSYAWLCDASSTLSNGMTANGNTLTITSVPANTTYQITVTAVKNGITYSGSATVKSE